MCKTDHPAARQKLDEIYPGQTGYQLIVEKPIRKGRRNVQNCASMFRFGLLGTARTIFDVPIDLNPGDIIWQMGKETSAVKRKNQVIYRSPKWSSYKAGWHAAFGDDPPSPRF